ncbi:MAG TPA: hypothetical protein PKJ41_00425 [Bryobacteraceae bacterium]|nr:hypothetical protein [Bryobacteraceae bacterium]HPT25148.1 hypothetical protein [Bryobacteraceae bacterium]
MKGQSFVFDGFGNLTQQVVTKGSAPSMSLTVNPANNRVTGTGVSYDAAGNLTSTLYGGNMSYDLASRLASVQGMSSLHYTARNERLTVHKSDGTREVHMRGLDGELIGVYKFSQGLAVVNGGMETGVSPWYAARRPDVLRSRTILVHIVLVDALDEFAKAPGDRLARFDIGLAESAGRDAAGGCSIDDHIESLG